MDKSFSTPRLDVYCCHHGHRMAGGTESDVYLAFCRSGLVPNPVCVLTIGRESFANGKVRPLFWIEVCERQRRQSIATEAFAGAQDLLGPLLLTPLSDSGRGFIESVARKGLYPEALAKIIVSKDQEKLARSEINKALAAAERQGIAFDADEVCTRLAEQFAAELE